jgi:nitrogen fixation NifU-like protein
MEDLYQEIIKDHSKNPFSYGIPENYILSEEAYNPLCGDRVTLYIQEDNNIFFEATACAICTASTSLMIQAIGGLTKEQIEELADKVHTMVTTGIIVDDSLGRLEALQGVSSYPMRVKCATMPWHLLKSML